MKCLITVGVFLLLSVPAIGQIEMNWGVGVSYNTHFFIHENKDKFENSFFKPDIAHLPRINTCIDLNTGSAFQFRLDLNLGEKKIIHSNKQTIPSGGRLKQYIKHEIISADLSFLSYYSLSRGKMGEFRPLVGFYISMNQYTGIVHGSSISSRGGPNHINENDLFPVILEVEQYPFMLYAGINLGLSYSTKIAKRDVEFFGLFYFSPSNLFSSDFGYYANFQQETLNGKYHYFSLGMNLKLKRK